MITNSLQLHSNFSNQSEKMRIVQYLRYCPATSEAVARDGRCSLRAFDHYPSFKSDIEVLYFFIFDYSIQLFNYQLFNCLIV